MVPALKAPFGLNGSKTKNKVFTRSVNDCVNLMHIVCDFKHKSSIYKLEYFFWLFDEYIDLPVIDRYFRLTYRLNDSQTL